MTVPVPCVVCGVELSEVMPGITENQPLSGAVAMLPGTYGSAAFDPFDGSHLEIVVCDRCLVAAGMKGRVLIGRQSRAVTYEGAVVGYEDLESRLDVWTQSHPGFHDQRRLTSEEFSNPPMGVRIFPVAQSTVPTATTDS